MNQKHIFKITLTICGDISLEIVAMSVPLFSSISPSAFFIRKTRKVRRGVVKKPAGKTVDGKELVIEEYPGLFGIASFFGGAR